MRKATLSVILSVVLCSIITTNVFAFGPIRVTQNARSVTITASTNELGGNLDVGWNQFVESANEESEWQEASYSGTDFSVEIQYTDNRAGYLYLEADLFVATGIPEWPWLDCESDCSYSNEFWFDVLLEEEIVKAIRKEEKADSPWGSIAFHSNADVLAVFTLDGVLLGEGKPENGVWKTGFAEGQEFLVYEWSESAGHELYGYGKVLAGLDGHTDVWNEGAESSIIDNFLWAPSEAL